MIVLLPGVVRLYKHEKRQSEVRQNHGISVGLAEGSFVFGAERHDLANGASVGFVSYLKARLGLSLAAHGAAPQTRLKLALTI
jgi:hypothetical protein